jgi:pantoate ligase/cytidylate kinase
MGATPAKLLTTLAGLRCYREQAVAAGSQGGEVGLVPTMGALHAGHLSLMEQARQQNQIVIVSIFVNPLQFGPNEDFSRYPRTLEPDLLLCQQAGVDAVFAPAAATLLGPQQGALTQVVPPPDMLRQLCALTRPDHFQGVSTIVTKLLHLVAPQRVYFGQKDAQQLAIVRRLVQDLNLPVEVVSCPIVRDADGLALSSRNQYLSPTDKQTALLIYRGLQRAQDLFDEGEARADHLTQVVTETWAGATNLEPEYVALVDPETLQPLEQVTRLGLLAVAARVGQTRLIDNCLLDARKPILAIDGPAGAGKSTVTRLAAQALQLNYLDTGAMYRAITWLVQDAGINPQDLTAVAELVSQCQLELVADPGAEGAIQVWVNGQKVTDQIRSLEVTRAVSEIAAQPAVRQVLVQQQRRLARDGGIAVEGRDMGTHVFPEAGLKIFLTASVAERARRRHLDLQQLGLATMPLPQLIDEIEQRDYLDSHRPYAPFRKAADAIEVITDDLTIPMVVEQITHYYQQRFPRHARRLPGLSLAESLTNL